MCKKYVYDIFLQLDILFDELTWANANEEASMPTVAIAPPSTAVRLNPIESIKIPAIGETKKVIPMESDPTSAVMEKQNMLHNRHWQRFG